MKVKLVVVAGTTRAQEFKLRLPAILGRGRSCSVQLPHALVSRQHCEVFEADGKLRIRDLGSLNGTLVDGQKITECVVSDGQQLNVGTVTFRIEIASDDANAWLAPPEQGGASSIGKAKPVPAAASGKNLASRSAIGQAKASVAPADFAEDQLAAESVDTEAADARETSDSSDLLPPTALPKKATKPKAAKPKAGTPHAGTPAVAPVELPPKATSPTVLPPSAVPAGVPVLPPQLPPSVSPPTMPMAIPGAALAAFQQTGVPVSGVPLSGAPMAGVPIAGIPVAGIPVAGVPVAGVPVAGVPVAGVPVAGVPVAGVPAKSSTGAQPVTAAESAAASTVPTVPQTPIPLGGIKPGAPKRESATPPATTSQNNAAHANTMDADEDLTAFLKSLRK